MHASRRPLPVRLAGLAAAAGLLAGATVAAAPTEAPAGTPRVVVAVPDSASNPYHEFFHQQPLQVDQAVLDELGVDDDHIIRLTRTGDYFADQDADWEQFEKVEVGELYWFEGTNLFSISFEPGQIPLLPDHAANSHGVGTTSAVMMANPEAIVISIEGVTDEAEAWAFGQPFVDIVSTSYGLYGSPPVPGPFDGTNGVEDSHAGVVERGKIHVGASDNTPAVSSFDYTSGPWWSLGVAGLHEDDGRSREISSGNVPDFVSDFTQDLPYCGNCEEGTRNVSGTSFATPRIAGTISKVLLEARRKAGHVGGILVEGEDVPVMARGNGVDLTNWDLRRAFEEAAWYPESREDSATNTEGYGVPPEAPYTFIGWGLVTSDESFDVVGQALAHLDLVDEDPYRFKSSEACAYMTAHIQARATFWDDLATDNPSNGGFERYRSC